MLNRNTLKTAVLLAAVGDQPPLTVLYRHLQAAPAQPVVHATGHAQRAAVPGHQLVLATGAKGATGAQEVDRLHEAGLALAVATRDQSQPGGQLEADRHQVSQAVDLDLG